MVSNDRSTLSIKETALMLGISKNLAYELARRNELPGVIRLGCKRMVVSIPAIEHLLRGEDAQKGEGD